MIAGVKKSTFLPAQLREQLLRGGRAGAGVGLVALAVFMTVALVSHHGDDPSLNTATATKAQNLMGVPGALLSDLLLQAFGYAAYILVPVFACWGGRLVAAKSISRLWLKSLLLPVCLLILAALSAFSGGAKPDLAVAGPGGITGKVLAETVILPWATANGLSGILVWLPASLCAFGLLLYLLAFTRPEWTVGLKFAWRLIRRVTAEAHKTIRRLRRGGEDDLVIAPAEPEPEPAEPKFKPVTKKVKLVEKKESAPKRTKRVAKPRQSSLDLGTNDGTFGLPALNLLQTPGASNGKSAAVNKASLEQNARLLESVLQDFGVRGEIVKVRPGPVVTLYELEPAPGTKTSRVIGLSDDIARSMSAISVRIATVPGRNVIGIELPNSSRETVLLRELMAADDYERNKGKLPMVLGKDIGGTPVIADLAKMPHLLIAGTTGSGKSVGLNAMILSLLYRLGPVDCRFIMIDPKMLELSIYHDIPHLLAPVVTDPKKAVVALKWTVREMEDRYQAMSKLGVRNIEGYNKRVSEAAKKGEVLTRRLQTGFDPETGQAVFEEQELDLSPLPFIVVVVDEMADLMLVAGKDIEASIQRLAQMARAAGIHLIMATQRPSVDVITGTIKANFPTRISFQVTSKVDSRTILGEQGAEQLLGQGDMLYTAPGGQLTRVHGPFVSDEEVEAVADHLRAQDEPQYNETVTEEEDGEAGGFGSGGSEADALYDKAVALVCQEQKASTSFIQRHLQIGYNRAARIMEQMEKQGVVSAANHVGKREILVGSH